MSKAKAIMVQGTASGVGKSTIAIGLCRLFARKGIRVAPFKAQNLSDNAHILPDGSQMARSQAVAAAACGIAPHTDMNPVLLKPFHGGCETILDGVAVEQLSPELKQERIMAAFHRLAGEYDLIVAEGAGSPVELNLIAGDIVNMGFAQRINCPVLLVADIRRGGIFASAYGTVALLEPAQRALVRGLIVNDFYGDPSSFGEGMRILSEITKVPVLGTVPHLDLCLEDEDSLQGADTKTRAHTAARIPDGMTFGQYQELQFDRLADALAACLDISAIEAVLEGEGSDGRL